MSNPYGAIAGVGPGLPQRSPSPPPQKQTEDPCRVTIGPAVLSYPKILIPEMKKSDKADREDYLQYSCEFWVYESNPRYNEILQKLTTAFNAAVLAGWPDGRVPRFPNLTIKRLHDNVKYEGEPGLMIRANTNAKNKTGQDRKLRVVKGKPPVPVTDAEDVYPGVIGYASVTAAHYKLDTGSGVKWYLNEVWLTADGPRLVRESRSDFEGMEDQVVCSFNSAPDMFAGMPGYSPPAGMYQMPGMPQPTVPGPIPY